MNVTFLIGNGFDLNLGLDTLYTDFLAEYLRDDPNDSEEIKIFKNDIHRRETEDKQKSEDDKRLWANAELAFGEYTQDVFDEQKSAEVFSDRHDDFCEKLAAYLQIQESRVQMDGKEQEFIDAIQNFHNGLSDAQEITVNNAEVVEDGGYVFNFIVFNYTKILDGIIASIRKGKQNFAVRVVRGNRAFNSIGKVIHVHGTTTHNMILGVNDESQIKNIDLFNGGSPSDINSIIKLRTNKNNGMLVDEKASEMIKASTCIYIYGMSLGDTDKIWWQRIIKHMKSKPNVQVFIYGFDAPKGTLIQRSFWRYSERKQADFFRFCDGESTGLMERIHIIRTNIFEPFKGIATPLVQNSKVELFDEIVPLNL